MALRLRFSLGTLVLSVLLIGAVAAFYWNWQEWLPVRTHTYDRRIEHVDYSPTGKYYYFTCRRSVTDTSGTAKLEVVALIHDARTGEKVSETTMDPNGVSSQYFTAKDRYFAAACNTKEKGGRANELSMDKVALVHLVDLETREDLVTKFPELLNFHPRAVSPDGRRALVHDKRTHTFVVADFPTFENRVPVQFGEHAWVVGGSKLGDHFLVRDGGTLVCVNRDGTIARKFILESDRSLHSADSRDGRLFVFEDSRFTICDLQGGAPDKLIKLNIRSCHLSDDCTRLLYLDQSSNLHWHNLETGEDKMLGASQGNMTPFVTGDTASTFFKEDRVWDMRDGNLIFDLVNLKGTQRWSWIHESHIAYADDADRKRVKIFDYKRGKSLGELSRFRCFRELNGGNYDTAFVGDRKFNAAFSKDGNELVFITKNSDEGAKYSVFRLNNRWGGIPAMPEFWIAVLILAALIWNVRRNRRTIPKSTGDTSH